MIGFRRWIRSLCLFCVIGGISVPAEAARVWSEATASAPWLERTQPTCLVHDGRMWVFAGDQAGPPPYSIGTLQIGPSATTVRLLDRHDNQGAGSRSRRTREAMYVQHLILEPGVTLDLGGLKLYYETVSPGDPLVPDCGVSVIDSVGGGRLIRLISQNGHTA